jgi:hypothetical protein
MGRIALARFMFELPKYCENGTKWEAGKSLTAREKRVGVRRKITEALA